MTLLLEAPSIHTAELSVVRRNVNSREEVKTMTTAMASTTESVARPARPRGFSRAVLRLGFALVKWSRNRAARTALTHEEQARRIETEKAIAATTLVPDGRPNFH
jgi:hypothetical protein